MFEMVIYRDLSLFLKDKSIWGHTFSEVAAFPRLCRIALSWNLQGVSRMIIRPYYKELMVHFPCQQSQRLTRRCADLYRWGSKPISMLKTPRAPKKKKKRGGERPYVREGG